VTTPFNELLNQYRSAARSQREKGTYFERLTKIWLEHAPTQAGRYARVLTYADFAHERGESGTDTGIDLVAELADDPGRWCAIQCKFYAEGYRLQRADIDGFLAASARAPFARRLFVDTTGVNWTEHAETTFREQAIETQRIGLTELAESGIDWAAFSADGTVRPIAKKRPRPDQVEAIECVTEKLATADRGKLIMACGTGKTFTGLKIAEAMAGRGGRVLFLVPSLALMQQTVREWSIDSEAPLRSFAVCSDTQVGVRRAKDDTTDIDAHDLEIPATTNASVLAAKATTPDVARMTVIFSTYQSLPTIAVAQEKFGLPAFDLIICDEAHRTTGVTLSGEDESNFVRVHDANYIRGAKRLYMTATPRVYGEAVRQVARDEDAALVSMDDPALYGETLFTRSFGWAVQNNLLTDYKVIVLAINEADVAAGLQARLADDDSALVLDDATKLVGCYKALTKADFAGEANGSPRPMRRAIAFAKSIAASKTVAAEFGRVAADWRASLETVAPELAEEMPPLEVAVEHVDGGFNAKARDHLLSWLKADTGRDDECRILTNARCLSEGVDVPALDAVLFLHPRKSQIDVVQAVGRVMRRAPGKELGYVILPVGIPAGVAAEDALNSNEKYRVVWQILNALRSHDERLDATINKIDLGVDPGDRIEIIAVANELPTRAQNAGGGIGIGGEGGAGDTDPGDERPAAPGPAQDSLAFRFDEVSRAIMARIVKKCGTRTYWEEWAKDVAGIAQAQVTRIAAIVSAPDSTERAAFERFLAEIRDDLNDSITEAEAIEMLAQHLITRPVFEALFEGYDFAASNPVSRALESVLSVLDRHNLDREAEGLERFYASVRLRAAGIDGAAAKQKIVLELYDKFFKTAFPTLSKKLGIVYTPVEIVDFIIRSIDEALRDSFGQTLASEGVHIIDPFTGTGTFVTRLLQSGLIPPDQLARKYAHEIHANEIVLLAYYIAAINIEATFHELSGGDYQPFPGICLTDTFQLYERDDLIAEEFRDNSGRRTRQKALDIRVIIGNPPYSDGQETANDNAANVAYPHLDGRVRDTYAARSSARNKNGLYNSYIRAMRWASDRIGDRGIVSFVTNGGWVDGNSADGIRRCLQEEFAELYIFHLKGDARTSGEQRRREKDNVFGVGTRTPIAVWLFVKNPDADHHGRIHFHAVDDYLTREQKLAEVTRLGSMNGVATRQGWRLIEPDAHGDWLSQRDGSFAELMAMGDKDGKERVKLFASYSAGVKTQRDWWAFNPSRTALGANIGRMIDAYNAELMRFDAAHPNATRKEREDAIDRFVDTDSRKISWTRALKDMAVKGRPLAYNEAASTRSLYRPFTPQALYFDRALNEMVYKMPSIFPAAGCENQVICISGVGGKVAFGAIMADGVPSLHFADMGGSQCFPLWLYEPAAPDADLAPEETFGEGERRYRRRPGITPEALDAYRTALDDPALGHEAVFYYAYSLLHAPDYRARFADTLAKELPRLPVPTDRAVFDAFERAGRELADLHCGFETVEPFPVTLVQGDLRLINIPDPATFWRVDKMRFGGRQGDYDRSIIHYNHNLTLTGVPLEAYDYVVNGKSAIEWVMEWQGVRTDTASGITKDANAYAREEAGDPRYPFDLLARVIAISLRTREIVSSLPTWQA
jgi:predicted helicase